MTAKAAKTVKAAKAPRKVRLSPDEDLFLDLFVGMISPAGIGIKLAVLGLQWNTNL